MKVNRRTLLTAIGGTATAALAGCSGGGDGSQNNNGNGGGSSTGSGEWTEVDLSQEVQFNFPEGERITYESKPPAQVEGVTAYVRGDVLEVRGTLIVSEQIRQVVEIRGELKQGGETVAEPETTVERPGPGEDHPFTTTAQSSDINSVDSLTLYVNGPEPQT
ncbi:hypothetical protein [Halobacterium noricense]|uniref:hypothetical protein n=1 Tax=Halobacterium noricense TaxID=223182 RepID=UPI001E3C4290|nr:hypothetical protein [Halobacterium noricense]UHH27296.1 hypothetical protein LT974_17520 [Halobacterium noricense]